MEIDIKIKSTDDGKLRVSETIGRCAGVGTFDSFQEAVFSLIRTYEAERIDALLSKQNVA
jgi:chromosome condensin MukBEF MukE localization factor